MITHSNKNVGVGNGFLNLMVKERSYGKENSSG
nr:MAG TPA: hypothetical protein [Caudoviricetes sp.]